MMLHKLTIRGYKSIAELEDFELRRLNMLIGANGAGKSNFISLFRLLAAMSEGNLQRYVQAEGGPDALLYRGRKRTKQMEAEFYFARNGYRFALTPTADNRLVFTKESTWFKGDSKDHTDLLGTAHEEARLGSSRTPVSEFVRPAVRSWRIYHFHDTSNSAGVKQPHPSNDNLRLKPAAENLAAYLARLSTGFPDAYLRIVEVIKLAAPFFGGFVIRDPLPEMVELEWYEQSDPDTPRKAHMLSDGTLRFICLATLLMQPPHMLPTTVLIDEPELGLHPYAINLLAEMLKQTAESNQVIASTQSVELLNAFAPENVLVVEREADASVLKRLDPEELAHWLEDYTLGELWKRNVLGGRPTR
jgi:predicted ATPase